MNENTSCFTFVSCVLPPLSCSLRLLVELCCLQLLSFNLSMAKILSVGKYCCCDVAIILTWCVQKSAKIPDFLVGLKLKKKKYLRRLSVVTQSSQLPW